MPWLKGAHSGRDVLGSGQPKFIADSVVLTGAGSPDGTDYIDVGKVVLLAFPSRKSFSPNSSFLMGKVELWGGARQKIGLLQGYSYTCLVS